MMSSNRPAGQVTVYSRPGCVQCNATYRALDAKGVTYEICEIDDATAEQLAIEGHRQLPVVKAPGMAAWAGFRPDKIDDLTATIGSTR